MRNFNRFIGFFAVGFVLAFMGKVSKTDLYNVYFKSIAEIGTRNSQDLPVSFSSYSVVDDQAGAVNPEVGGGSALLIDEMPEIKVFANVSGEEAAGVEDGTTGRDWFLTSVSPRAPSL